MTNFLKGISFKLIFLFFAYRLVNALIVETFHVPDEYWQSLEVAHRSVFGYGFLTWEWQPYATLRSYLHPFLFAVLYKCLAWTSLDRVWPTSLVLLPKLFQASFAAVGDLFLHQFAQENYGKSFAIWFSIANLTNWFLLHNITRTLANSIETVLFSIFLCFWPVFTHSVHQYDEEEAESRMINHRRVALMVAGVCFLLRPTSAITWAFFACHHLYTTPKRVQFLIEAIVISICVLMAGAVIDVQFYGHFVSPLFSFLKFNFLSSGAAHYGSHPWHWYFSNGIPMLLGPYTLAMIVALARRPNHRNKWALALLATNLLAFSLIGHKEARFLMPLIPILHLLVADTLMSWWDTTHRSNPLSKILNHSNVGLALQPRHHADVFQHITQSSKLRRYPSQISAHDIKQRTETKKQSNITNSFKTALVLLLISASLGMAIYTCSVHQRGTMDLMTWLRHEPEIKDLLLLMPCHHTPGLAFIHRPDFQMDYLDCSPGLPKGQLDEADVFYEDPILFLNERFSSPSNRMNTADQTNLSSKSGSTFVNNPHYEKDSGLHFTTISEPMKERTLPSHIAMYNSLLKEPKIEEWLIHNGYEMRISFFHAHFADGRVGKEVLVYRRNL